MIIVTDKGERLKTTEPPQENEYWKKDPSCARFWVRGCRWLKSGKWSEHALVYRFKSFTEEKKA